MGRRKKEVVASESEEKLEPVEESEEVEPTQEEQEPTQSEESTESVDEESSEAESVEAPLAQSADVYGKDGGFIRSYCFDIHGPNFAALARQFAQKIGGRVS